MSHYLYLGAVTRYSGPGRATAVTMPRAEYIRARVRVANARTRGYLTAAARQAIDKIPGLSSAQRSKLLQTPVEGLLELLDPVEGTISAIAQDAYPRANAAARRAVDRLPQPLQWTGLTRRLYNACRFAILVGMDPGAVALASVRFGLPDPRDLVKALVTGAQNLWNQAVGAGASTGQQLLAQGQQAVTSLVTTATGRLGLRGLGSLGHYAYLGDDEYLGNTIDPNDTAGAQPEADPTSPPAQDPANGGDSPTTKDDSGTKDNKDKEDAKRVAAVAAIVTALLTPEMIRLMGDLMKFGLASTITIATGGKITPNRGGQPPPPAPPPAGIPAGAGGGLLSMKIAGIPVVPALGIGALALFLTKK